MRKKIFLYCSRFAGLFYLSAYFTRRGLRILCYHGFASGDEAKFRPRLFINPETFERRLAHLRKKRYPVLSLDDALKKLTNGGLPNLAVVMTIDDGWAGTPKTARPMLSAFSFPATLYVTTYHAAKNTPVFQLVVQYILWKTTEQALDLSDLGVVPARKIRLTDAEEKERAADEIIRHGETRCDEEGRVLLATRLGKILGVDFEGIRLSRILNLVTPEEIRSLAKEGMDIQLHTHRHRLGFDQLQVSREITDNRAILEPLVGGSLRHFCYPSGEWSRDLFPWLEALGIKSAVTCDPGLNYGHTSAFGLKRFLDGEHVSQVEFEAELSGFNELMRRTRSRLRHLLPSKANARDVRSEAASV
jgi:peptidoglycan/xylan/chitin deacetylase (PgdA/CDA1 family)